MVKGALLALFLIFLMIFNIQREPETKTPGDLQLRDSGILKGSIAQHCKPVAAIAAGHRVPVLEAANLEIKVSAGGAPLEGSEG